MTYIFEKSPDNKAIFTLTIPKADVEAGMKKAAQTLSEDSSIPGFRPGKAPYEALVARHGEMKLLDIAAEDLIRHAFVEAVEKEGIVTTGQPYFHAEKLAPGNDVVIRAEIALYPTITKLADPAALKVEKKNVEPSTEDIEKALNSLADMQTSEEKAPEDHVLTMGDKAITIITLKDGAVVLEGGEAREQAVYTTEAFYIPGFVDGILGAKAGETKTFPLTFPTDYHAKHLAGRAVQFEVEVKEIFLRDKPTVDDAFAAKLGLKDRAELEARLKENLMNENTVEELRRQDTEILNLVTDKSQFEQIPDLLVNQEVDRMVQELEYNVEQSGGIFEEYLKQINKTLPDIKLDFTKTAIKRIQASLFIAAYAKEHNVTISDEAMAAFMQDAQSEYGEKAQEYIDNPRYQAFAQERLLHTAVLSALRELMVK